jgi:hypothetical protein
MSVVADNVCNRDMKHAQYMFISRLYEFRGKFSKRYVTGTFQNLRTENSEQSPKATQALRTPLLPGNNEKECYPSSIYRKLIQGGNLLNVNNIRSKVLSAVADYMQYGR